MVRPATIDFDGRDNLFLCLFYHFYLLVSATDVNRYVHASNFTSLFYSTLWKTCVFARYFPTTKSSKISRRISDQDFVIKTHFYNFIVVVFSLICLVFIR